MSEHLTKREMQAIHSRQHILDTCAKLVETKDWNEIKISDICEAAHISVGAFYHYFKSKSDILINADWRMDQYFYETVLPHALKMRPDEGLFYYLSCQSDYYSGFGVNVFRNLFKAMLDDKTFFASIPDRGFIRGIYTILEQARDEHLLPATADLWGLTHQLLGLDYGVYYFWCVTAPNIDIHQYADTVFRTYLRSVFTLPEQAHTPASEYHPMDSVLK